MGFPGGTAVKNPSANAGGIRDPGSIPRVARSPGAGNGSTFQYFCLGKFHRKRSLEGYSPWGHNESDMTEHTQAIQTIIVSYSLGIFVIFRISFQFAAVPRVICQKNFFPLCSLSNNDKMICQQAPAWNSYLLIYLQLKLVSHHILNVCREWT